MRAIGSRWIPGQESISNGSSRLWEFVGRKGTMQMWAVASFVVIPILFSTAVSVRETIIPKTITVVYDNNPYKKGLKTAWGFSCLVRGWGKTILFDTGGDGRVLLANMRGLRIDPHEIGMVVLSHIHGDHVGGLASLLQHHHGLTVFVPPSFPSDFKKGVRHFGARLQEVEDFIELCPDVYSTGEMGTWIKEQALILRSSQGLIVITGCAHPGIVEILEKIGGRFQEDILLVMGGFHLMDKSVNEIKEVIASFQWLGVRYVGPGHCSGDVARRLFQEAYGNAFLPVGVGMEIRIDELQ
jgi:7,8-dihydropterin-6-yl-methyl-4-(beta-D-ribofuranosyl)aminobenzene 5'-phosphate synthase